MRSDNTSLLRDIDFHSKSAIRTDRSSAPARLATALRQLRLRIFRAHAAVGGSRKYSLSIEVSAPNFARFGSARWRESRTFGAAAIYA